MIRQPTVDEVRNALAQVNQYLDQPVVYNLAPVHLYIIRESMQLATQWQTEMNRVEYNTKSTFEFSVMFVNGEWVGLLNCWDTVDHEMEQESYKSDCYYEVVKQAYEFYLTVRVQFKNA